MESTITKRLDLIRDRFNSYNIDAFIIPTDDAHLSEYTAAHWEFRKWASGFTGSAGTLIVLRDKAALWTDSRYFIQAARQLKGSGIELMKLKIPETPTIEEYLANHSVQDVGIDCKLFPHSQIKAWKRLNIIDCPELIDEVWKERPPMPNSKVTVYEKKYAGMSIEEKIAAIREKFEGRADGLMLSALDEIAWTLNIRGADIHCNPVIVSFLLITKTEVSFFVDLDKLTPESERYLKSHHIDLLPYSEVYHQQEKLNGQHILVDPDKTNEALYHSLPYPQDAVSPVTLLKAVRNTTEIKGIHNAMIRDGIAMIRFLQWLQKAVCSEKETELSVSRKLHEFRAAQALFMDESFDTIVGYAANAAIVHYEPIPETDTVIRPKGFLLIDSGAQYLDGTTDITRTIAMGPLTDDEKHDYTLILKGHIDLAMSIFPTGTTGGQLDAFARMPIWKEHKNFLHGTGHGVGHFLSVHEGPQSIRMEQNPTAFLPGMITSNEPGLYIEGRYGIRIENLVCAVKDGEGMFGSYLRFETLTLCPISTEPIQKELLTTDEIKWLNDYHQYVFVKLSPYLTDKERIWLKKTTAEI